MLSLKIVTPLSKHSVNIILAQEICSSTIINTTIINTARIVSVRSRVYVTVGGPSVP